MASCNQNVKRHFTDAARAAAQAARRAKWAEPDRFGEPEMFVVRSDDKGFTWELRRFGGVVLERGAGAFGDVASAKDAGSEALTAFCQTPDVPKFVREIRPKLSLAD